MKKILFKLIQLATFNYYFKAGEKNSLLILMFHRVNDSRSKFYCPMPVTAFKALCEFVKERYEVINISEIQSHFKKSNKPAAIISFDDGHYDIMENAFPVLAALGLKFNVNIDTEVLETGKPQDFVRVYDVLNSTNIQSYKHAELMDQPIIIDRLNTIATEKQFTKLLSGLPAAQKRAVTDDLTAVAGMDNKNFAKMLNSNDLKTLSKYGVEFGSHTHTHSFLTNLTEDQIKFELTHSKNILEGILQKPVEVLAYPNGKYNATVETIAQQMGYKYLLQTDDEINLVENNDNKCNSYKRVSQYHHSLPEALAHTYGITKLIRKFKP